MAFLYLLGLLAWRAVGVGRETSTTCSFGSAKGEASTARGLGATWGLGRVGRAQEGKWRT